MATTVVEPDLTFTVSPFPEPGDPVWDAEALEWYLYDADGRVYWGTTPAACLAQYDDQMRRTAEHARKSGLSILELRALWTHNTPAR